MRLRANDIDAIIARWINWMDSPGLEDVLTTMKIPSLLYASEADRRYKMIRQCGGLISKATSFSLPGQNRVSTFLRGDLVLPHVTDFLKKVEKTD